MTTWFIGAVLALAPLEEIRIETPDGSEISGVISAIKPDAVVVHEGAGKHTRVEFAQMTAVEIEGAAIETPELRMEVADYIQQRYGSAQQPTPSPGAVVLASSLLPGAGHRLLGDRETFRAYAVADAVTLGLAALLILDRQRFAEGLPLLALDVTFRVYSAAEARKEARIRRENHSREDLSAPPPVF